MSVYSFEDGFEAARQLDDDAPLEPPYYESCSCANQTKFRLFIESGDVGLDCIECGKSPGWMEEFVDCMSMEDILVTVKNTNIPGKNCSCNMMEQLSHDCGPEFITRVQKPAMDMQCPDTTPHGPHTWLLEGRIAAACPGK